MPLTIAYSRHLERQADRFAIDHIPNKDSFASIMARLAKQDLDDPSPNWLEVILLHDHPPTTERIKLAHDYSTSR